MFSIGTVVVISLIMSGMLDVDTWGWVVLGFGIPGIIEAMIPND